MRAVAGLVSIEGRSSSSRCSRVGSSVEDDAAQQDGAESEGEGAQGHQHGDLGRAQALRRIGPVAHDGAGKHRGADIVRQGIGGERGDGDEQPRDVAHAQMQQRDPVVPGQGRIGDEGRQAGEGVAVGRHGRQAVPDVVEGQAAKLTIEKPAGNDDCQKPDHGPNELTHILHRAGSAPSFPLLCPQSPWSARGYCRCTRHDIRSNSDGEAVERQAVVIARCQRRRAVARQSPDQSGLAP